MRRRHTRDYTPTRGSWARTAGIGLAGALLIGAGLAIGLLFCGGDQPTSTTWPAVPHGPTRIVDGIPTGYTHDPAGAASAATGWEYALSAAGNGILDPTRILTTLATGSQTGAVTRTVDDLNPRRGSQTVGITVPLAVTITDYTPDQAGVSLWSCAIAANQAPGQPITGGTSCGTTHLALAWQSNDWKIADRTWQTGPDPDQYAPGRAGKLPLPGGLTVFVR